jgi:glutathione S-transferase
VSGGVLPATSPNLTPPPVHDSLGPAIFSAEQREGGQMAKLFGVLDELLRENPYLEGKRFGVSDVAVGCVHSLYRPPPPTPPLLNLIVLPPTQVLPCLHPALLP